VDVEEVAEEAVEDLEEENEEDSVVTKVKVDSVVDLDDVINLTKKKKRASKREVVLEEEEASEEADPEEEAHEEKKDQKIPVHLHKRLCLLPIYLSALMMMALLKSSKMQLSHLNLLTL